jgi:hypothetical protein
MPNVVVVLVKNGSVYNTAVVPWRVPVPEGNQTITWSVAGPNARFPENNFFWWKTEPPPLGGTIPTRSSDGQTLTLSYNNEHGGVWVYGIRVENDETSIAIDPEVDNGPPR